MSNKELDISSVLTWEDGLPHPKWDLIRLWVESQSDPASQWVNWLTVTREWFAELGSALDGEYESVESEHFLVLAPIWTGSADRFWNSPSNAGHPCCQFSVGWLTSTGLASNWSWPCETGMTTIATSPSIRRGANKANQPACTSGRIIRMSPSSAASSRMRATLWLTS